MVPVLTLWMAAVLQLSHAAIYTNDWAVKVNGNRQCVDRIAAKYGFINMGQIGDLKGYYSFRHPETASRSTVSNKEVTGHIAKEDKVEWLQQQVVHRRAKRTSRGGGPIHRAGTGAERFAEPLHFTDPEWNSLQYIHCRDDSKGCQPGMNIEGAWRMGYTGKGVVVSVLDDGIEREHPDLEPNYDPLASYDVNGQDQDPTPSYPDKAANYHGTLCAGMIAAAANNSLCTVGVSFRARIGGVRMLAGDVTDIVEAQSLSFRPQYIDIYLASWGPEDDGATVEGPGYLTRLALQNSVQTGRHGMGSVFVGASGNGGRAGDHCSCDGYSNSIYTISISSTSRHGHHPDYLEQCSSTLAAAYGGEETVTLGPQQTCRRTLSGTSLSSSVAAGILALMLEANPSLTWRDVQHIIVRTSKADHLTAPDWHRNGAGYKVSHLYGFGLLDAEGMVKEAESWKQVPPQHECVEDAAIQLSRLIHPGSVLTSEYETKGCSGEAPQHVVYLEHVVVRVTISHSRRGDLSITLTSPSGTVSQMLANRPLDNSTEGFQDWEFMTVHCWGEQAAGKWTLKIQDTLSYERGETKPGVLEKWSLVMFGTAELPYSSAHRLRTRAAEIPAASDVTEEYNGPCDPECSEDGCDGPGPQQCVTCLHFFLKFKNNTRLCVSECPAGFWGDRRRCKRCFSFCQSCTGSRSDQCTSCQPGYHLTEETSTCSASCGDNYYLDHDTNVCRKCSENCLKCTSYSICTECKQDTSLQGNRCQPSCAPGFYHDTQEGTCKPCHTACATCAGAGSEACSLCAEGFFTEEWRCVSSCSPGFYSTEPSPENADGQRICRRCDASCLTCAGPSRGNCSSCSRGHSLQDGVCVINTACADGEYPDSEGLCHPCDSTCLKCTGRRSQDCISCAPSRVLDEGRCLEACAKGKYPSGGRCHLCDHTCAACVDAGPSNCTSCDTDKFGMERYLHQGLCVETCPEAFFHTEKTCEPCSQDCQLCSSLNRCLKCNPSFYLSDGRCVKLECGEGEVEDPDYDDCMACEEGCKKCVLYNPRHCLSCIDGFYNFQDGCYRNCPAKTYSVEEEMSCVPCDDNCVSCDEHECYWCETDLFLSDGKCVSVCPDGFYGDEDSSECEECHADCDTCSGPEEDDCLSCEEGKMLESSLCVPDDEACPIKTFLSDDGACEDCHPSCESCSGHEKNQCTKCANGRFLTLQQTCVSKCPTGFFASRLSGVCEECPPGCLQCVNAELCSRCLNSRRTLLFLQDGKCVQECVRGYPVGQLCRSCAPGCASCERNATHCVSCEEPLLLHKHQCVEECPEGHTARDRQCHHCPAACRDCTALGECTDCEEYHFLHEGLCVQSCPERFYEDNERGECSRCHSDCALCDGPSGSDCDACVDPEATLHNGACLPSCPPNTYRDAVTAECQDCDESCLTCSGPDVNSCTSCRDDWKLDDHSHCTPSSSKCSSHQYSDSDGKCHPCHKYCHRCWGPGKDHCLSCSQRHFLLNGSCVDECPAGYFKEESGQKCEPCHASCQTCVGKNSLQCLTCKAHLFREAKECVETCQPGHYGNSDSRTCEKCDPSCGECTDGGEEDCLSCSLGLVYLRNEGRCLPSCPPGYHRDSSHRTCEPCHSSCRTCSGKFESCESCFPGYQLSDGRCKSMCDPGQHPVSEGSHYTCEDCDSSCLECRAAGPFNCTACPDQAILEAGGRCLPCCQHEEDGGGDATAQQDCCNCTETRGECVLSTNLPFRNSEEEEARGNLTIFIIACILLVLALVGVALLVRHSRSKGKQSDLPPRGYEKLGSGRFGAGYSSASTASYSGPASSSGGRFQDQLVDIGRAGSKDDDDDDDEDDEDIVYMGKDGTVYRKFRYGQLGEDNDDELEYDDESYTFR